MIIIGIDPGKTGFIVQLNSDSLIARTYPIPFRKDEIIDYRAIKWHFDFKLADLIVLEKVSVQPHWSATSSMTFGKIVGQLQMLISQHSFMEISSRIWQKEVHVGFADHMDAKAKSAAAFARINPNYESKKKIDHNMIDAFHIADWGLRKNNILARSSWTFEHIPKNA